MANKVQIRYAALAPSEDPSDPTGIVLRGEIVPETLHHLQVDRYQREVLPLTPRSKLIQGFLKKSHIPDIDLGMRGQRYTEKDGVYTLHDPVYVIDGLQRMSAAIMYLSQNREHSIRLGCTLHFQTDLDYEESRFEILNGSARTKVSPNIHLRNAARKNDAVGLLYNLTQETTNFPLHHRVQWGQRMNRSELVTARQLFFTNNQLHSHKHPIGKNLEQAMETAPHLLEIVGSNNVRHNIMAFYKLIDVAWGVRTVQYREIAPQIKGVFNAVLARFLSDHTNFWKDDDRRLFIDAPFVKKIAAFPIRDPNVSALCSSTGGASTLLYSMLKNHVDSGRRIYRLEMRESRQPLDVNDEE